MGQGILAATCSVELCNPTVLWRFTVPEPPTLLLLVAGLVGLVGLMGARTLRRV